MQNIFKKNNETKKIQMGISAFIAEHNVAYSVVEHLIETLKNNVTDSVLIKEISLMRKKCTEL